MAAKNIAGLKKGLYKSVRFGMEGVSGESKAVGPVMNLARALAKPKMSRREFLGDTGKIGAELRLQKKLSNVTVDLHKDQRDAITWLQRPDIQRRINRLRNSKSNPRMASDEFGYYGDVDDYQIGHRFFKSWQSPGKESAFKRKVRDKLEISLAGWTESAGYRGFMKGGSEGFKPKTNADKYFDLRQKLSDRYGFNFGTGTYLQKAFKSPGPKVDLQGRMGEAQAARNYIDLHSANKKDILAYIRSLAKNVKEQNPIIAAFREGLRG